jgi:hypothetical protein
VIHLLLPKPLIVRDIDVRVALQAQELSQFVDDPDSRIVHELGILQGNSRIDVAVINGALHGYEIKSARDTLSRLPTQIQAYNRVFDTVTIVAAKPHIISVRSMIPSWWGVIEASETSSGVVLRKRRRERLNGRIDPLAIAQLLWKEEAFALLEREGRSRGMRSKSRQAIWKALAEQIQPEVLRLYVRSVLKARADWRPDSPPL